MKMPPKLSIQITLHNRADFIKASILSALNCGYDDTEILVFDDASSDNSGNVVKSLIAEHPGKIRYIRSEENLGCAKARATLVRETDAEYILPHDDDDIMLPFDIAGQIDFLDRNPDIAVSYGKIILTDENLKPTGAFMGSAFSRFILSYWNPVASATSIIRRKDLLDAGNYIPAGNTVKTVATDLFLWFRLSQKKDLHFDNSFRLLYRQHPNQLTSNKDVFLETANFIHNNVIDNNKDIYERILSGKITAAPNEMRTVIILLSIISRYMQPDSPQRLQVLNAAATLAPNDYGINLLKFDYFFEHKNYPEALAEAEKALNNPEADFYVRRVSLEKILKVCEINGTDTAEIRRQVASLREEYIKFDPAVLKTYL